MNGLMASERLRFSRTRPPRTPQTSIRRSKQALRLFLGMLLLASPADPAVAEKIDWKGTLRIDLGNFPPLEFAGSGVATVNGNAGGPRLESLRIAGGISGSGTIPITDPYVTATYRSLRISPQLGTGTLSPFWPIEAWPQPQLRRNTLPVRGSLRLCMYFSGCRAGSVTPLSEDSGANAVGVGGSVTGGDFGAYRVSIEAAPWTVYSATLRLETPYGATTDRIRSGWIHGPASFSSSAATPGGALQLVTPLVVRSNLGMYLPGFASLTLRFVPEPGFGPLMAAGILALSAIHRAAKARSRIATRGNLHDVEDTRKTPR